MYCVEYLVLMIATLGKIIGGWSQLCDLIN